MWFKYDTSSDLILASLRFTISSGTGTPHEKSIQLMEHFAPLADAVAKMEKAQQVTAATRTISIPLNRARSELSVFDLQKPGQAPSPEILSRRFSWTLNLPARPRSYESSGPTQRQDLETQRFERMIDHFQVRRVVPTRPSPGSVSVVHAQSEHAPHLTVVSREDYVSVKRSSSRPAGVFSPSGPATDLRVGALILAFAMEVASMPFVAVYGRLDDSLWTQGLWLRVALDAIFIANIFLIGNTATHTARARLVASHRSIWRQYRRNGLRLDIAAGLPFGLAARRLDWMLSLIVALQLFIRGLVVSRQWHQLQLNSSREHTRRERRCLDWLLYSRFSHLVRIGRLIVFVIVFAHYMACIWSLLSVSTTQNARESSVSVYRLHLHSVYEILQLLQGQGVDTNTISQEVFCSIAVLLGSITLAVVFGHVAVLVANFSANQDAYQRKMESVFAIMGKLRLPKPIRERVHEYYEYLHSEYESLDGEVVKFTKELSHTLELEVVLFKYMDVVMHVPYWRECSPDFQKQLVLNLRVRVYLPDDYVIRRGEVGTECYIINRGFCKQLVVGDDEIPSPPLVEDHFTTTYQSRFDRHEGSDCRFVVGDGVLEDSNGAANDTHSRTSSLSRGQCFGEKALLINYQRTSDVRAFTCVEMCVLERDAFQKILTRYPLDRTIVLSSIISHCAAQSESINGECNLLKAAYKVAPHATRDEAIRLIVGAMSPIVSDPSSTIGVVDALPELIQRILRTEQQTTTHEQATRGVGNTLNEQVVPGLAELHARLSKMEGQLDRLEHSLERLMGLAQSAEQAIFPPLEPQTANTTASSPLKHRPTRRSSESSLAHRLVESQHTMYADRLFSSNVSVTKKIR